MSRKVKVQLTKHVQYEMIFEVTDEEFDIIKDIDNDDIDMLDGSSLKKNDNGHMTLSLNKQYEILEKVWDDKLNEIEGDEILYDVTVVELS